MMFKVALSVVTYLFGYFKTKKNEQAPECVSDLTCSKRLTLAELIARIDFTTIPDPVITNETCGKTVLILDDIIESKLMYNTDFSKIKRKYKVDPNKDFRIVYANGSKAGYIAYRYVMDTNNPIDIALLDITLGGIIKFDDGNYIEIDGVDIAIELYKRNPDIKFVFATSHTLNRGASDMLYYFDKFEEATGENLCRYYLDKNNNDKENDRALQIKKLLYGQ